MRKNINNFKISRIFFWILIWALPVNLGYHLILRSSFVVGFLVDYLIPTVYLQDILALFCVGFWIIEQKLNIFTLLKYLFLRSRLARVSAGYVYICLLSVFVSVAYTSSFFAAVRLLLYFTVSLYFAIEIKATDSLKKLTRIFTFQLIFLGILAAGQFFKQGALFNNYLILGEQPYTASTHGITLENFFNTYRVPAYALFRHPNVFAGFVCILLIWIYWSVEISEEQSVLYVWGFLLGILSLLFTVSYFAFLAFLLGIAFIKFNGSRKVAKWVLLSLVMALFSAAFLLPIFKDVSSLNASPSFYRRLFLLDASYKLFPEHALFGLGYNSITLHIEKYLPSLGIVRFVQPVHNIFVLAFIETGVVGGVLFCLVFILALYKAYKNQYLIFINIVQILVIGSYDHYFYTIHQTHLLFWLLIGFLL